MTDIENYERSYNSLWREIAEARRARDNATTLNDVARDLAIALRHDLGTGAKVSELTMSALNRLESRIIDVKGP